MVNAVPVLWVGPSSRQTASRGKDLAGVAGDGQSVVLPADAANPEPGNLVAALTGEEPGQGDGPDQLDRIGAAVRGREIAGLDVQALNWALITMMTRCLTRKSPQTSQWTRRTLA
ncbi:hypothetical protein [Streptomyces sp. NPDC019890]|uniref:hypothetical protein n=1 Tax=Streptomyces sp. NPDC019890 TaxID=3365064 RepID=UPI00384C68A1